MFFFFFENIFHKNLLKKLTIIIKKYIDWFITYMLLIWGILLFQINSNYIFDRWQKKKKIKQPKNIIERFYNNLNALKTENNNDAQFIYCENEILWKLQIYNSHSFIKYWNVRFFNIFKLWTGCFAIIKKFYDFNPNIIMKYSV